MRHPLYLSSALGFAGAGLVLQSIALTVAFLGIFFITHWSTMRREEQRLRRDFPDEFAEYSRRVPRFIPRIRWPRFPEERVFKPAKFSRALIECALIPLIFPAALVVAWAREHSLLPSLFRIL